MTIIKHYDLSTLELSKILKTSLKKKHDSPVYDITRVEGSALNYLVLAPYKYEDSYIIACPLRKSLQTRFMVGGGARNDYYHITGNPHKSTDKIKRFAPVKSLLLDNEEPHIKFKRNSDKHYLVTDDLAVFIAIYTATRYPKQSTDQINKYLLDIYKTNNDRYHQGTDDSDLTDNVFDQLRRYLIEKGLVKSTDTGAAPAPNSKKVTLKEPLGSLENAFTTEELTKFFKKYPASTEMIGTPKIDGISGQINYVNGKLVNGNTKGNGLVGEDITQLLKLIPEVPKTLKRAQTIQIRSELFIKNSVFNKKYSKESGRAKPYANPRGMVAGLKNRNNPDPVLSKDLSVLGYSIIGSNKNKSDQLAELKSLGFPTVDWDTFKLKDLSKAEGNLAKNKSNYDFDQDGYVVDINDAKYRNEFIGGGINPRYAIAFKADTETGETEIISITYNISKDKYAKPTANTKPVKLSGATVTSFTLHNARKVVDLKLGPGAIVLCQRSGDAIPHILKTIRPAKVIGLPKPDEWGGWFWSATKADIILNDDVQSDEHEIERINTFFSALKIERFSGGLITAFYNAGFKTIPDILHATKADILKKVPRQGETSVSNILNEFKKLKDPGVKLPDLLYASGCFGRGLGKLKFTDLYKEYGDELVSGWTGSRLDDIARSISELHGFSYDTGKQFALGIKSYIAFYKDIRDVVNVKSMSAAKSGILTGQVITLSEFRDKQLGAKIEDMGGLYAEGYSKKTTILLIPRAGVTSTKTAKANKDGTTIMTLTDFKNKYKL